MRALRIIGVIAFATIVLAGSAAEAPKQVVFVLFDTPTMFLLAEGDLGVTYTILQPPVHGVLVGIPPNLTYVPHPGFSGTDWVHYLVQTEVGEWDLGAVQLVVLPAAVTMSPFVLMTEGEMVWSGPTFAWDRYRFVFAIHSRFAYFEQIVRATWTDVGFTSFVGTTRIEIEGTWPSPWRLPITSTLDFNPAIPGLSSWTVGARTTVLGATWIYAFHFSGTAPQTGSHTTYQVQGTVGPLTFDSRIRFDYLTPTFSEARLLLRGPWICDGCPTNWEMTFLQTKAGFDELSLLIRDVEIPVLPVGRIATFLDVTVTYRVDRKTVEPVLRVVSDWEVCARPFVALETPEGAVGLAGIEVYGAEIRCEVPGGYTLRMATSFNLLMDSRVTGFARFFQLWQLEGPVAPCCGSPGRFQVSAYSTRRSGTLFGFGMGNFILFFPVSREVLLNVGLMVGEVDPGDPTKAWILTMGWKGLF
ncbi:TPA: hypothetical protein DCY65_05290 [Candidatus Acetothermia bacterium]|nr:hypothetical protein [Candidatus Acetothermia bacterium]